MQDVLEHCRHLPRTALAAGAVVLREKEASGRLYVLVDGTMEVFRDEIVIAATSEPGAVFGEMSVLLGIPHTASVRTATPATVHVIEDAAAFLSADPALALPVARILARRLQHATTYLVDLTRQFRDRGDHLEMVGEVLEALTHEQAQPFTRPPDRIRDP